MEEEFRPPNSKEIWLSPMEVNQLSRILTAELERIQNIPTKEFNYISEKVMWITTIQEIRNKVIG